VLVLLYFFMPVSPLLPDTAELRLDQILSEPQSITVVVATVRPTACCPACQQPSTRVHSHYVRSLADLPWSGATVRLRLHTRRFFCSSPTCSRRIFTERLPKTAARYARRTTRLNEALQFVGLALGGEAGARLAARLGMAVSGDTLLRRIRQLTVADEPTPRVLGVDDWAWKRGHRYGTILVDLERRRVIDLLPDRQAETLASWLQQHPGVEVISRDRAGAYADGARRGAPRARQVADRWPLLANLSECVREWLERHRPLLQQAMTPAPIRQPESTIPVDHALPQQEGKNRWQRLAEQRRTRRLARYQQVRQLRQQGYSERAIARQLRISRKVVRRFLAAPAFPERAARPPRVTLLTPFHEYLQRRWTEGCHNAAQLLREISQQGYRGKRRAVNEFVAKWRRTENQPVVLSARDLLSRTPSPRWAAFLLLQPAEKRTNEQQSFVDRLVRLDEVGQVAELARQFVQIIRDRQSEELDGWIERAKNSAVPELRRFAAGLKRDDAAVRAALEEPWSNGPVEGQVHRLKLIKRQMYGRGKLDLLRARLQHAA
jgi:transposase